jgi:hypothetical protein
VVQQSGKQRNIKIIISVFAIVLLTAGLVVFYIFDPDTYIFFPRCLFFVFTGLECPGCGTQRAIHHVLHLNFRQAFSYNTLMLLFVPYILIGAYFIFLDGRARFPRVEKVLFGKWVALIAVAIILIYWVWRNI